MNRFLLHTKRLWILPVMLINFSLFMTPNLTIYGFISFFYTMGYFTRDQINKYKVRKEKFLRKSMINKNKPTKNYGKKQTTRRLTTQKSKL
jgi:hypothetical protein